MPNYFRALMERQAQDGEPGSPMRFTASTENIARDGLVIEANAWDLKNYRANPIVLWVHDYAGRNLPIGRATVEMENNRLVSDIVFDQADEFARQVESKYRRGFLNAVSVGWDTKEMSPGKTKSERGRVLRAELLDISAVPVPGDPHALIQREARAMREILNEYEAQQQPASDVATLWDGVASAMLALYRSPATLEDADDHRAIYNQLERVYRKLGKTPPEYREPGELGALDVDSIDGLFLEGEARIGATLNARNRERLEQIRTLAQEVIDSAAKEDKSNQDERKMDDAEMSKMQAMVDLMDKMKSMLASMMEKSDEHSAQPDATLQRLHQIFTGV